MLLNTIFLTALAYIPSTLAVTYNWELTWVNRNPDGLQWRPVIGINGQWPLPIVRAAVGETIVVNLKNSLVNETSGLHFHGLFQNGSNSMDGPTGLTQCPVAAGATFTYSFTVGRVFQLLQCEANISSRSISLALTGTIVSTTLVLS